MSTEVELFALAVLLYLYDSVMLLYRNEAILSCDRRRCWHVSTASRAFFIAGRGVCFLNPVTTFRPSVKLYWDVWGTDLSGAQEEWSEELGQLREAAPWTGAATCALFVMLPLGLFTPLGVYAIIPAVIVLYGSLIVALFLVGRQRAVLTLTVPRIVGLAFECLACPPFGVNLVRRATLTKEISEPLLSASARLLPAAEWEALRVHCLATVDQEIARCDDASAEKAVLVGQRLRLSSWVQR